MANKPTPAVSKLVSRLRIRVKHEPRKLANYGEGPRGPEGRLWKLRRYVTQLIKHERIELKSPVALEARGYTERLISDAIRNGDSHKPTMDQADFWLEEKQLVHKLFKVLVPRYQNSQSSYTSVFTAPTVLKDSVAWKYSILELKGNPLPPVIVEKIPRENLLHNILLAEAKEDFHKQRKNAQKIKEALLKNVHKEECEPETLSEEASSSSDTDASKNVSENQDLKVETEKPLK